MSDAVNHPSHYNQAGKKECIEQMRADYGDTITAVFCLTNAYKYLYRAGEKADNSKEQDIAKARWYYNYSEKLYINTTDMRFIGYLNELDLYVRNQLKEVDK